MIDVKELARPVSGPAGTAIKRVALPSGIPLAVFWRERQRFLETWRDALPDLPNDEIDGTIRNVGQLAALLRGGRS